MSTVGTLHHLVDANGKGTGRAIYHGYVYPYLLKAQREERVASCDTMVKAWSRERSPLLRGHTSCTHRETPRMWKRHGLALRFSTEHNGTWCLVGAP